MRSSDTSARSLSSPHRPLIGITGRRRPVSEPQPPLIGAHESYLRAIVAAGGLPVIIPPLDEIEGAPMQLYERCQAILLPGGEDVTPELYGAARSPHTQQGDRSRDELETEVIRRAVAEGKPLLGICRGSQMLNVALGGTLHQHLEDDIGRDICHVPPPERSRKHRHAISIDPASRLAALLDTDHAEVNSFHHQGIDRLGSGLRAVAAAPDGAIEAIELTSHPFCLGVICHPELLLDVVDPPWLRVFAALVDAAFTFST